MLRLMPFSVVSASRKSIGSVPGKEFNRCQGSCDGCRAFLFKVQVCQIPVNLIGRYRGGVEARGDL